MMRFTKKDIEKLAKEIIAFCIEYDCDDTCIYFNDKRIRMEYDAETEMVVAVEDGEGYDPHQYFDAAYNHILSMSFEGTLYSAFNYYSSEMMLYEFNKIFKRRNLIYEFGDAWNLTVYAGPDMEVEYTYYQNQKPAIKIGSTDRPSRIFNPELNSVIDIWEILVSRKEPVGSIVSGSGIYFEMQRDKYFLKTDWRQSETPMDIIDILKHKLDFIGATNIYYDCGRMV